MAQTESTEAKLKERLEQTRVRQLRELIFDHFARISQLLCLLPPHPPCECVPLRAKIGSIGCRLVLAIQCWARFAASGTQGRQRADGDPGRDQGAAPTHGPACREHPLRALLQPGRRGRRPGQAPAGAGHGVAGCRRHRGRICGFFLAFFSTMTSASV